MWGMFHGGGISRNLLFEDLNFIGQGKKTSILEIFTPPILSNKICKVVSFSEYHDNEKHEIHPSFGSLFNYGICPI